MANIITRKHWFFCLALALFVLIGLVLTGTAMADTPERYYQSQLDKNGKIFYQALVDLYAEGWFKEGNISVNVTDVPLAGDRVKQADDRDRVSQEDLQEYADNGDPSLLYSLQAARDAFMHDYPEIFYVNFDKIGIRFARNNDGIVALVGNGGYKDYYDGFANAAEIEAAQAELDAAVAPIIQEAKKLQNNALQPESAAIRYVHDAIITQVSYTFTNQAGAGIKPYIDDAYGALVKGKALCEGYARSFKLIMDELGVPCLLVVGGGTWEPGAEARPEAEGHMWNYVQLGGKWYGVDVTYDDPVKSDGSPDLLPCGRDLYFLRGSDNFLANHAPSGLFSQGGHMFRYPALEATDYNRYDGEGANDRLTVEVSTAVEEVNGFLTTFTYFKVLFDGKVPRDLLAQDNLEVLARYKYDGKETIWSALTAFVGSDSTGVVPMFAVDGHEITDMQFAVVTTKITDPKTPIPEEDIVAISGLYQIKDEYRLQYRPWPIAVSPATSGALKGDGPFHVKVVYDAQLKLKTDGLPAGMSVVTNYSLPKYKITNFTWRNDEEKNLGIIEFDFKPDTSYNYSATTYEFTPENLVSLANGTIPAPTYQKWICERLYAAPCPKCPPVNDRILAPYPKLVSAEYPSQLFTEYANKPAEAQGSLDITLIASKPSRQVEDSMIEALDEALAVEGVEKKDYLAFDLGVTCQAQRVSIKSGNRLFLALPYPQGFDPRTGSGAQFEAYHFKEDPQNPGAYIAEKLVCHATDSGLWVLVDSFSPFALVQLKDGMAAPATEEKALIVQANQEMATVSVTGSPLTGPQMCVMNNDNPSRVVTITPKEGYSIASVTVDGVEQTITAPAAGFTHSASFANMRNNVIITATLQADMVAEETNNLHLTPVVADLRITAPQAPAELISSPVADPDQPSHNSGGFSGGGVAPIVAVSGPALLNTEPGLAYMNGVGGGYFAPDRNITRAETAAIFYRLLKDATQGGTKEFSDVPANAWYKKAAEKLAGLGVLGGYADGSFRGGVYISRAEFISIATGFADLPPGQASFSDVPANHWAAEKIAAAAAKGWISGYADGSFRPDAKITRAEAVVIVNRVLNRQGPSDAPAPMFIDVPATHWAYEDILSATGK